MRHDLHNRIPKRGRNRMAPGLLGANLKQHGSLCALMLGLLALTGMPLPVAHAQAQGRNEVAWGRVPAQKLACGCHIRIDDLACPGRSTENGPHLFTGLDANAPLLLQWGGKDIELAHLLHEGGSVKGDAPGRWTDRYESSDLSARIVYAPGKSSCRKLDGEACEYTDYRTSVVLQPRGQPPRSYRATATCGC